MKFIFILSSILLSINSFATYDGNVVLDYLEEGTHKGVSLNGNGACYVQVKKYESPDSITLYISKDSELTDHFTYFNNNLRYNLVSENIKPDKLEVIISLFNGAFTSKKAKLEITRHSLGMDIYIENRREIHSNWIMRDFGYCRLPSIINY
jgi:hypothetical protein